MTDRVKDHMDHGVREQLLYMVKHVLKFSRI